MSSQKLFRAVFAGMSLLLLGFAAPLIGQQKPGKEKGDLRTNQVNRTGDFDMMRKASAASR